MTKSTLYDRPTRISPALRQEVERMNLQKFAGRLPFARATEVYVEETRKLEEQNKKLQQMLDRLKGKGGLV